MSSSSSVLTSVRPLFQNVDVTSEKLASLSVADLYLLADRMGLDLPSGLERPFVLEEILDALAEEREENLESRGDALRVEAMKYSGSEPDAPYVQQEPSPTLERRYKRDHDMGSRPRSLLGICLLGHLGLGARDAPSR